MPKRTIEDKVQIFLNEHDRSAVDRILCVNNIEKFIVMHTTTLVQSKNWDHFSNTISLFPVFYPLFPQPIRSLNLEPPGAFRGEVL